MRARRGLGVGWAVVVAYATLLGVVALGSVDDHGRVERPDDEEPASDRFITAWERSRTATFVASGTFERRSDVTGARIGSEDVLVQRPPRRLHRQLGGVEGRDDDRLLVCPSAPPGQDAPRCQLGDAGGPTYAQSVATEVAALRTIVGGANPVYRVTAVGGACFELDQRRIEPRAPFGINARFCFDGDTGAPSASRVRYQGGVVEVLAVTDIRTDVRDADLVP